jgi:cytochrome c553
MRRVLKIVLIAHVLYSMTAFGQADENEVVLHKFSFCMVCHGYQAQGNTTVLAPSLAGIEPWYLSSALEAYRSSTRHTSAKALEMQAAARMIDETEDAEAMKFIAQMPIGKPQTVAASEEQLMRGAQGYAQFCAACHGIEAEGNELLAAPSLARLSSWYLKSAWQAFREGDRGDSNASVAAQQMRQFTLSLSDEIVIEDLIAFITETN